MVNSFETWDSINEGMTSKQIYVAPGPGGNKFKVVIKIQDNKNFMIKAVREMQLLDSSSNMTNDGASAIKNYLNSQQGFTNTFGKIDTSFFKDKFIIYTVIKDTNRVEKIQFTVVNRSEAEGLDSNIQFVPTKNLEALKNKTESLAGIIRGNVTTAKSDNIEGTTEQAVDASTGDADGSNITKKAAGSRFRYTMRTNGVTYLFEIADVNGHIDMEPISGHKGPIGAIDWKNPKIMWFTDWDNDNTKSSSSPLYMDTEITNNTDVEFFTKIFTDKEFLNNTVAEYEDEYGSSEITADNLRNMLYYGSGDKKDSQIFPSSSGSSSSATGDGTQSMGGEYIDTQLIG